MPKPLMPDAAIARKKAADGNRARAAAAILVGNEYVTGTEVAQRMGVPPTTARVLLQRARAMPGKVTWERLAELRQAMLVRGRGRAKEA